MDIDLINQIYKNIIQVRLEEEENLINIVKKIQLLEDDLFPSSVKELKNIELKDKKEDFIFKLNPEFSTDFLNNMKNFWIKNFFFVILMKITIFM